MIFKDQSVNWELLEVPDWNLVTSKGNAAGHTLVCQDEPVLKEKMG